MHRKLRIISLLAFGLGASAWADPVDERLQALEQRIGVLEQENAKLKQQLSVRPDAAPVTPQGKEAKLAVGGFIQFHGEAGDAPDARFPAADRFLVRRARIGLKGTFAEHFDFVIQTDLGNNSLAATNGYRAQLTDAFVTWNKYGFATITAGQFRVPYGYEQLQGDVKIPTIERSLTNDMLTLPRQAAVMIAGTALQNRLNYALALGNGNGANVSFNDNEQFATVGRVNGTIYEAGAVKLSAGINAYSSYDTGAFTGRRTGRGADAQVTVGPAELDAEILRTQFDRDTGPDYDATGWVLTATYAVIPNTLRAVVRYENYDPNTTAAGDRTVERLVGVDYFLKGDDIKLSFNYVFGNPPGASKHQDRLLGRLQIVY